MTGNCGSGRDLPFQGSDSDRVAIPSPGGRRRSFGSCSGRTATMASKPLSRASASIAFRSDTATSRGSTSPLILPDATILSCMYFRTSASSPQSGTGASNPLFPKTVSPICLACRVLPSTETTATCLSCEASSGDNAVVKRPAKAGATETRKRITTAAVRRSIRSSSRHCLIGRRSIRLGRRGDCRRRVELR